MVSTSMQTRGGIASYVRMLRGTALWTDWRVEHVATHRDGPAQAKAAAFLAGLARYGCALVLRRPDVVHLHMSSKGSFVRKATLFWMAWAVRVPAVVHVHGSEFDVFHDKLPAPLRAVVRATLTHASVVVALGNRWAERLARIAPGARVVTVPNAVPVPAARPAPTGDGPHVVFLGEIGERKGAFVLLDAWAKLTTDPSAVAGAHLTLAGDGGVERARAAVAELGIAQTVDVRSWLSAPAVAELLDSAHVFVLPSRNEGQPMAILEAMSRGLCIVACDVGGIPEMIEDGRSGLLVPPDDTEALCTALGRVLAEPELRARLGGRAHDRASAEFDVDVVSRRLDAVYRKAVGT
jgi:glycosyltransferase involved in cell wall biosynthesis